MLGDGFTKPFHIFINLLALSPIRTKYIPGANPVTSILCTPIGRYLDYLHHFFALIASFLALLALLE